MNRWARAALVLAMVLVPLVPAFASAPELVRLFPFEAEISGPRAGLVHLPLPEAVLGATRPDLSDLRVFDFRGREVPYVLDGRRRADAALEVTETFVPEVLALQRDVREPEDAPDRHTEVYRLSAPPAPERGDHWELVFDVKAREFVRSVRISGLGDGGTRTELAADEALFRLDQDTQRLSIPLPPPAGAGFATIEVEIRGSEGSFLAPKFRFESRRRYGPLGQRVVPLAVLDQESRDGRTFVELERPAGIVPTRLRIETRSGTFRRPVRVYGAQQGRADRKLASGRLFRVSALQRVERLELPLDVARGSSLRVEIDDGDAPPLEELSFYAVLSQPVLIFDLPDPGDGSARGLLRFGGGRAHRPYYAISGALVPESGALQGEDALLAIALQGPEAAAPVELGAVRRNPLFDATPALAFAMHPGAAIDGRRFAYLRAVDITPSAEGLSWLPLAPEDVARSEADLADLRIVDAASQQWPYLMHRDARRVDVTLLQAETSTHRRVTSYRLAVPEGQAPLRIQRITLRASAPYLDRAFRLIARDGDGVERQLAQGRLVKDARRPRPLQIGFRPTPVSELELRVENGDDAPLEFSAVQARALLPDLFLVAPQGRYSLLVGDPGARAPSYELERVRDVVLAVESHAATTQPLEANPAFRLAARLGGEDGPTQLLQTGLVWGVLLLAVVALGALTLRAARAPGEDEAADG